MGIASSKSNINKLKKIAKELGENSDSYISLIKTDTKTQKETKNNDRTN